MPDTSKSTTHGARWVIPATATVIGVGYLVAGIVGDRVRFGVFGLLLMLSVAVVFVLAARVSETFGGLADRRDERINEIDQRATTLAGVVVLLSVLVMFMVSIARGQDGSPYYQLGAIGGVTYIVGLVYLRFRG